MVKIFTYFAVLLFSFSFSQEIKLSKSAKKFEKEGVSYKLSEYKTKFTNLVAKNYIQEGRTYRTIANIMGFSGGLLIGAGLPNALTQEKSANIYNPNTGNFTKVKTSKPGWTLVGVGIGVVAVAIPLAVIGKNKVKKGVETENKFAPKAQYYQFDFTGEGLALTYNF